MALIETTRTVKSKTLTFIEVSTTDGILKDGLSAYDITVLNDVDTNGTGADLVTKLTGYTLSNGKDALDVYGPNIYNMDNYADLVLKKFLSGSRQSTTNAEQETTLADHETRITALEP